GGATGRRPAAPWGLGWRRPELAGPARNGARGAAYLSAGEGIASAKGRHCRGFFPRPPSKWRYWLVGWQAGRVEKPRQSTRRRKPDGLVTAWLGGRCLRPRPAGFTPPKPQLGGPEPPPCRGEVPGPVRAALTP